MGKTILLFYKKCDEKYKFSFMITFILGVLTHAFLFSNFFFNHDGVHNIYCNQDLLQSGRWALSLSTSFSSWFYLPWIIGILSLIFISLTSVFIVRIFDVNNKIVIILISAILATFPSVTQTFYFLYTADGYMLAMFIASVSSFLVINEKESLKTIILSTILMSIACGIYQTYFTYAIILQMVYILFAVLQDKFNNDKELIRYIIRRIICIVLALIIYYIIWKICMYVVGVEAYDYKGIDQVQNVSGIASMLTPKRMVMALIDCYKIFLWFLIEHNFIKHGITVYAIFNILIICVFGLNICRLIINSRKNIVKVITICAILVLIPPVMCMWRLASDSILYNAMMLMPMNILYIFTIIHADITMRERYANIVMTVFVCTVVNFAILANIGYFFMQHCYDKSFADAVLLLEDIRNVAREHEGEMSHNECNNCLSSYRGSNESYECIDVCFIGTVEDFDKLQDTKLGSRATYTSRLLEYNLITHGAAEYYMNNILDAHLNVVERDKELYTTMPSWPKEGSVFFDKGVVVVKFGD